MAPAPAAPPASGPLSIQGLGMVSVYGPGVVMGCAAARAGISRAAALDGVEAWSSGDCTMEPVAGYEVPWLTRGFTGVGRLIRLGQAALEDLCGQSDPAGWGRVGVVINVDSGFDFLASFAVDAGKSGLSPTLEAKLEGERRQRRAQLESRLVPALAALTGISFAPAARRVSFGGSAGFVTALAEARQWLAAGAIDTCLVGGIESQTEPQAIEVLQRLHALKTPDRPTGRMPGEAAAFSVVRDARSARHRGAAPLASLFWSGVAREPASPPSPPAATGQAMAAAISGLLRAIPGGPGRPGLVISDLTGEDFRARDWGCALVRLRRDGALVEVPEWYPAMHFGTIGAAMGPVAVCMACRGFARGYARTDSILAWLHSNDGGRSALYLQRA